MLIVTVTIIIALAFLGGVEYSRAVWYSKGFNACVRLQLENRMQLRRDNNDKING